MFRVSCVDRSRKGFQRSFQRNPSWNARHAYACIIHRRHKLCRQLWKWLAKLENLRYNMYTICRIVLEIAATSSYLFLKELWLLRLLEPIRRASVIRKIRCILLFQKINFHRLEENFHERENEWMWKMLLGNLQKFSPFDLAKLKMFPRSFKN